MEGDQSVWAASRDGDRRVVGDHRRGRATMIVWPFLWAIRCYQVLLRPMLQGCCKFHPTCSEYAMEALSRYGVVKGTIKSLARILRCHPFSRGGVDFP
jgi:hypothetical protein